MWKAVWKFLKWGFCSKPFPPGYVPPNPPCLTDPGQEGLFAAVVS